MATDPSQLTQDKDFLAAAPDDQIKYLSSVDSDFAKASRADQIGYIQHITGKPPGAPKSAVSVPDDRSLLEHVAEDPNNIPLDSYTHATEHGLANIGKGLAQGVQGGLNLIKTAADAWNNPKADVGDAMLPNPHIEQVPGAIHDLSKSPYALGALGDAAGEAAGQTGFGVLTEKAGEAIPEALRRVLPSSPEADLTGNTYSKPGDHIAAALRSDTHVDVPAEAKNAHAAIEEGLADRGVATKDFKGRNGPAALKAGIDNAIDINEARAKQVIDPIRGETVDPKIFTDNPELAQRFLDKEGKLRQGVTYGDLDAERIKMNKELRSAGFYSKPPSAQYAAQDPLASTEAAVRQARDLVYSKAEQTTGLDLRPLKQTESSLIKLGDIADKTKNTLSAKGAVHATEPLRSKIAQTAKGVLNIKARPVSSFFSYEAPGLADPLADFNRHMKSAFPDIKPTEVLRNGKLVNPVQLPKYNLNLTNPPGETPRPIQDMLELSGGEHIPGQNLVLTPSGDMPPALQRVLALQNPGVPSPLYPGVKK